MIKRSFIGARSWGSQLMKHLRRNLTQGRPTPSRRQTAEGSALHLLRVRRPPAWADRAALAAKETGVEAGVDHAIVTGVHGGLAGLRSCFHGCKRLVCTCIA